MSNEPIFSGEVTRLRYQSPDSGFAVIALQPDDESTERIAVGNTLARLRPGDHVLLWGVEVTEAVHGEQISVERYELALPASAAGIVRYFKRFPGVGQGYAQRLLDALGPDAIRVALTTPDRVRELLPPVVAEIVIRGLNRESKDAQIHSALLALGLNSRQVAAAFSRWGVEAEDEVREDPYQLTVLKGVGFATADEVARRLGVAPDAPARIRAAAAHVLEEAADEGHTYLPLATLDQRACRLLTQPLPKLSEELTAMEIDGRIVLDGEAVYLAGLFRVEEAVAADLARLALSAARTEAVLSDGVGQQGLKYIGYEPDADQEAAVKAALTDTVSVITGAPGTGKSTCLRDVLDKAQKAGWRVACCAPTGRAAKRMEELTGRPASTIHRLLEYHPKEGWRCNNENPLRDDLIVVDEASMVNLGVFARLLDAIPTGARLLIVGDHDQLPPIGAGAVLRDLIASKAVRVSRLGTIHRQAADSSILKNAHRINAGLMPLRPSKEEAAQRREGGDFFFVQRKAQTTVEMAVTMACERIPQRYGLDPRRDVWVLAPMKDGVAGTEALNAAIRERLNPLLRGEADTPLRVGDRVMQRRNNYRINCFNGDTGFVESIDPLVVRFEDRSESEQLVTYTRDEASQVKLAWASTVHKAQGSEFPAVVLVLAARHYVMLSRSLLYTAWTRARQLLVVVGEERAIELAVDDAGRLNSERFSLLAERVGRVVQRARETGVVPVAAARKRAGVI